MDCRTTQRLFQDFIDYTLDEDQTVAFIDHVRSCDNCMKELDLYYTMFVSLRQMENNEALTLNYSEELLNDMADRYDHIKHERMTDTIINTAAIVFLSLFVLAALIFFILNQF